MSPTGIVANQKDNTTTPRARSIDSSRRIELAAATKKKSRVVKEVSLLAPHKLQQECKCLTAMIAYSIVCERHSTMTGNAVADAVLEYCHGVKHKAIVALFTLLLTGEGVFSDMWMKQTNHLGQEELVLNPYCILHHVTFLVYPSRKVRYGPRLKTVGLLLLGGH